MNGEPLLYDFRSPNRFSREQVRALQMVNETYARQMATVLSSTLRVVAHVNLLDVTPVSYDEYTRSLPNPSLLALLDFAPLSGTGIFHLPLDIVMGVVDRLLGGPGGENQPLRALSDIESGLSRNLVQRMVHELTYSFDTIGYLKGSVTSLEFDAQFLQLAPPSNTMLISRFQVKIGDLEAVSTLCIPVETIQPMLDSFTATPELEMTDSKREAMRNLTANMQEVGVDVRVAFRPITLTSQQVIELQVGDVLPLHHPVNQPLNMSADGVHLATAVPGSHGPRVACQLISL